jgi:hypothetical protein
MKTNIHFLSYLAQFFLQWEIFQIKFVEKIKARISCSVTFFFQNLAAYGIMWNNVVEPERRQIIIWSMRIACRIRKATHTLGMCNADCLCTAITVKRMHFNVTLYLQYTACPVVTSDLQWSPDISNLNLIFNWLDIFCEWFIYAQLDKTLLTCSLTYLLTNLLTYLLAYLLHGAESICENNRFSASQEIPRILWNSEGSLPLQMPALCPCP